MAEAKEGRIYRHYKDPKKRYRVLHVGVVAEDDLRKVVVYEQLYSCEGFPWGTKWCRDQASFEGTVGDSERFLLAED